MKEAKEIKEQMLQMAVQDVERLFVIIGELGFVGYKVSLYKLKGYSWQQCVNKIGVDRSTARRLFAKCKANGFDADLKRLFKLKN